MIFKLFTQNMEKTLKPFSHWIEFQQQIPTENNIFLE